MKEFELFNELKERIRRVQWSNDYVKLDKELGEIDLLLYKLRSLVISPVSIRRPDERVEVDFDRMMEDFE